MTERTHILIVDDEKAIRFFLSEELAQAGYAVQTAASGEEALARLQQQSVDLVILDLMMGGMGGLQVMEEIKRQPLPPQVIILTAHPSLDSAVGAMRRGSCDYLRKPCRAEELLDSVAKALAKRHETVQQQQLLHLIEKTARQLQPVPAPPANSAQPRFVEGQGILVDRETQAVSRRGKALSLTPTELRLLLCLMEQPGRPVSYCELASALHGQQCGEWYGEEARRALSTHLWRLRRKLGRAPNGVPYITNVRGYGYRFVGDDADPPPPHTRI